MLISRFSLDIRPCHMTGRVELHIEVRDSDNKYYGFTHILYEDDSESLLHRLFKYAEIALRKEITKAKQAEIVGT